MTAGYDGRAKRRKTKWQRPQEPRDHLILLAPGRTGAGVIQEIAKQAHWRVHEPLPEQLTRKLHSDVTMRVPARQLPGGDGVYVDPAEVLNQFVSLYQDMYWTVERDVLRIEVRDPRTEPSSLSTREQKIWEVIQRGLTGAPYLRELHNAGLRPRTKWVKDGCPGTYTGIATESDRKWIQYAQDEKSKISRKAKASGLEF